jgi:hypothetical protein
MINPDVTLKVSDLLEAIKDGCVRPDTPIGFAIESGAGGIENVSRLRYEVYDGQGFFVLMSDRHAGCVAGYTEDGDISVPSEADDLL